MSKRFASTFFIVLASILILCFMFVLLLFLLPGVYLFGVKYIGLNTHAGETGKVIISDQNIAENQKMGTFSGIIVNTYEIPVNIIFSDGYTYYLEYVDNYNGITTSKIKDPSILYSKDDLGNAVISVSEFHTLIYESATSKRYLNIYVPIQEVSQNEKFTLNLTVNSTKSPITFKTEREGYTAPATFNKLSLTTNKAIHYENNIEAVDYILSTSNSIEINDTSENNVKATNYDLTSTKGKIVVNTEVSGDLTCNTKLGRVLLISCRNLTANTSFGDVGYAGSDDGSVTVNGVADVHTRAGNITLGNVLGQSRLNSISSSSGNVTINTICDGSVSTQRGQINIKSVRRFEATTTTGKITIQEAKDSLNVRTTRGKVTLGGEKMLLNNVEVDSTLGKVTLLSASGSVNIKTISADVDFTNTNSKNININCGGTLSAVGLRGNVEIYVGKAVESMTFDSVKEGNTSITLGSECKEAYIYINANELKEVSYYVLGSTIEIQEFKNAEWQQDGGTHFDTYNDPTSLSPYSFTLDSDNAKIVLRYNIVAF